MSDQAKDQTDSMWMSVAEAAIACNVSPSTIWRAIKAKKLAARTLLVDGNSHGRKISRHDAEAWNE